MEVELFLKGNRGNGSGREESWEELEGVEVGETVVRMYYIRKNLFLIKNKPLILFTILTFLKT